MNDTITDWKSERDDQDILWLTLDKQGTDTNVLSVSVLEQLSSLLDEADERLPRAVVFRSGKPGGFIAGADVNEFLDVTTTQEALIMIKRGQSLFSRIEALRCPTIALIEGFCMGGGTELALACAYRIALDESGTRIGLPEVKLGIHPAYGGLVRSTAIVNPLKSLELMLTGRALSARAARAIGLIDDAQPRRQRNHGDQDRHQSNEISRQTTSHAHSPLAQPGGRPHSPQQETGLTLRRSVWSATRVRCQGRTDWLDDRSADWNPGPRRDA